jgi:hypothetical protein
MCRIVCEDITALEVVGNAHIYTYLQMLHRRVVGFARYT